MLGSVVLSVDCEVQMSHAITVGTSHCVILPQMNSCDTVVDRLLLTTLDCLNVI